MRDIEQAGALIASGRLLPFALTRAEERIAMSHLFIHGAGMSPAQIRSVTLPRPRLRLLRLLMDRLRGR